MSTWIFNHKLIFPLQLFRQTLLALTERDGSPVPLYLSMGQHRQQGTCDWLVRQLISDDDASAHPESVFLLDSASAERHRSLRTTGHLFYRQWEGDFQLWGTVREHGIKCQLSELLLVGAGMHRIKLDVPHDE